MPKTGYFVSSGYIGFVNGKEMLFASEKDYFEYMEEYDYESQS